MLPFVIGLLAIGTMVYGIFNLTGKTASNKKETAVKQIVQATRQQVAAIKLEEERKEKVDKVNGRPFDQIGEEKEKRDIWNELKREAERVEQEKNEEKQLDGDSLPYHDDIVRSLKIDLKEECGDDRRLYTASKKETLETEKEEYKLERTSMFVYSRSYQNAIYVDQIHENSEDGSKCNAENLSGGTDRRSDDVQRKIHYNDNPVFRVGIGDILDAVVTHKIVSDTKDSPVICNVSKDLLDISGEWVIIPSGSRVIGRAGQVGSMGASRLFIYFSKLILPSGVAIDLPPMETVGLETEGSLGVASSVERHFILKFGTAFLVGLLDGLGGFAQGQVSQGGGASYFIDRSSENFQEVNGEILQQYGNIPPTITINAGHRMKIYFPRAMEISGYQKARSRAYGRG